MAEWCNTLWRLNVMRILGLVHYGGINRGKCGPIGRYTTTVSDALSLTTRFLDTRPILFGLFLLPLTGWCFWKTWGAASLWWYNPGTRGKNHKKTVLYTPHALSFGNMTSTDMTAFAWTWRQILSDS